MQPYILHRRWAKLARGTSGAEVGSEGEHASGEDVDTGETENGHEVVDRVRELIVFRGIVGGEFEVGKERVRLQHHGCKLYE